MTKAEDLGRDEGGETN